MGFRSYVRQFFAAFFPPSPSFTAMGFPVRGLWFCAVFPRPRTAFWSGTTSLEAGQVAQKSFSMGFRSYVRQFFAAFFHCHGVSPSGGCGFARSFLAQEPRFGAGQVAQKSSFSMGFRSYVRQFFAAFFPPSPSFTAMVFPRPGAVVLRGLSSPKSAKH